MRGSLFVLYSLCYRSTLTQCRCTGGVLVCWLSNVVAVIMVNSHDRPYQHYWPSVRWIWQSGGLVNMQSVENGLCFVTKMWLTGDIRQIYFVIYADVYHVYGHLAFMSHIDERRNSSALEMELHLFIPPATKYGGVYWIHPVCLSVCLSVCPLTFRVHPVASTVQDGFFPYLVQMINCMRGCVACDDPSPWPISSRSLGLDLENRVRSVASTVLDGFFLYLAQMITIIRGCVAWYRYVFFKIWKFEFLANF